MKLPLLIILSVLLIFSSCNNNEEFVPDNNVRIIQEYPIIRNPDYKENPILPGQVFLNRCAVIKSKEELSILPLNFIDNQNLRAIDFNLEYLIACRILTDEDISAYSALAQISPIDNDLKISIEIVILPENTSNNPFEYIIVLRIPKVNYTNVRYSYTQK